MVQTFSKSAALQRAGGRIWAGCVYDVEKIINVIDAGLAALAQKRDE